MSANASVSASATRGSGGESPRRFGMQTASRDGQAGFHPVASPPVRSLSGRTYARNGHVYRAFRVDPYQWPAGYGYRRFVVGTPLPQVFWTQQNYIEDPAAYGVAAPDKDHQWVRYGPDLLLVNVQTGEVVDSVYGAFDESGRAQANAGAGVPDDTPVNGPKGAGGQTPL